MNAGAGAFGMEGVLEGNRRLGEAIEDLKEKHERRRQIEQAEDEAASRAAAAAAAAAPKKEAAIDFSGAAAAMAASSGEADGEPEDDAADAADAAQARDDAHDDDEDDELARIRAARLAALRRRKEAASRAGGECRVITQDEFLPQVTGTKRVVCTFTHVEFKERCLVVMKHMRNAAQLLPSTRFVELDAAKAPFFVEKLNVRVIPTTLFFIDGKTETRMFGFEGLETVAGGEDFTLKSLLRRLNKEGMVDRDEFMAALARIGATDDSDEEGDEDDAADAFTDE
ncbi:hypothetical protein FNF27_05952 [Cafeteria roenbergensis]|uniref:Thioredoxin domain-containing protein n=3 Tax=Cafeteria roenbergensis TaxID=33653 RepID=A0A5A8E599_CAFRO|nr:hypothetical protein FNF31_05201 [Cafeteria roenbergensis]KAA0172599.1 hypothetical protein FNF27_05952 [Cafeteria roenbergensis]